MPRQSCDLRGDLVATGCMYSYIMYIFVHSQWVIKGWSPHKNDRKLSFHVLSKD